MSLNEKQLEKLRKKAKERTVRTQNIEYTPDVIIKKIESLEIQLSPEYQRNHRWDNKTSSRLIESLILNIPIPLIYLSEDIDIGEDAEEGKARYSIIDGQQRLTAIRDFFTNKFPLTNLETFSELNDLYYNELPDFLIRRLEDRGIKFLRIDSTLDSELKYYIFEKLNRGSVNLEPQELRNSINRGKFNDLLKELAKESTFRKLLDIKNDNNPKVKKMEDVEIVLRFFAFGFEENYKTYTNIGLEIFLSNYMNEMNKRVIKDETILVTLKNDFLDVIDFIYKNFGVMAFSKYNETRVTKFNKAAFDALAISIYVEYNNIKDITVEFKEKHKNLFLTNKNFIKSINGATASTRKTNTRINSVRSLLQECND